MSKETKCNRIPHYNIKGEAQGPFDMSLQPVEEVNEDFNLPSPSEIFRLRREIIRG